MTLIVLRPLGIYRNGPRWPEAGRTVTPLQRVKGRSTAGDPDWPLAWVPSLGEWLRWLEWLYSANSSDAFRFIEVGPRHPAPPFFSTLPAQGNRPTCRAMAKSGLAPTFYVNHQRYDANCAVQRYIGTLLLTKGCTQRCWTHVIGLFTHWLLANACRTVFPACSISVTRPILYP